MSISPTRTITQASAPATAAKPAPAAKKDGFSFRDLVDIVNPLQHIPLVGSIYREITGDEIKSTSRIIGGALFGGVAGAAIGAVNALAVHKTGEDFGQLAMDKAGLRHKEAATAARDDENIPVIDVHPLKKDEIVWDEPRKTIEAKAEIKPEPVQNIEPAAGPAPQVAAPAMEEALPPAKDLAELDAKPATAPLQFQPTDKAEVPKNMMQALAKYESMQRMAKAEPEAVAKPSANPAAPVTHPYAGLAGIRRYN